MLSIFYSTNMSINFYLHNFSEYFLLRKKYPKYKELINKANNF
ncbi:hypothetical protein EDF66_103336 [Sphingobacterium sp. JUb20]|nr:hypothetical protein [Sphingobacterium sp. JUb21]TCR08784.1 hypothetical protein EDF66_103336 [Sphingobacterium sp. JUb20]